MVCRHTVWRILGGCQPWSTWLYATCLVPPTTKAWGTWLPSCTAACLHCISRAAV